MKKILSLLLIAAVCLSLFCACSVSVSENAEQYKFKSGKVYGSIIPANYKVEYDEQIPITADTVAAVRVARNDRGSIQLVFTCDTADITSVHGQLGSFAMSDGTALDASFTDLYREYYVYISESADKVTYPDPLVPLNETNNSVTVNQGKNCAFWFDVKTDLDAAAGVYYGDFTVTFSGGELVVPVEITVEDINIPTVSSIDTYAAVFTGLGSEYKNCSSEQVAELTAQMHEFLLDARLTPSLLLKTRGQFASAEEYADYVATSLEQDPRRTSTFVLYNSLPDLEEICDILRERGVLDRCFIYPFDEPTDGMHDEITSWLDTWSARTEGLPIMICTNSWHPWLLNKLNFWCSTKDITQNSGCAKQILNTGAKFWQYGNAFGGNIAENGVASTVNDYFELQKYDYIEGILYWSVYHSGQYDTINNEYLLWDRDMWNDPYCFLPGSQWDPNGGGASYFYPGMEGDGIVNENTVVESIRLRYITEGLEAYELLGIRKAQLAEMIESFGIGDTVAVNDLMSEYYDNASNAFVFTPYTASLDSGVFSAYDDVINTLMDDILDFESNKDVIIDIDSYDEDSLFYLRDILVYTASGASVSLGDRVFSEEVLGNGISVYSTTVEVRDSMSVINISVSKNGLTEMYERRIYARAVSEKTAVSIFGGTITQAQFDALNASNTRNPGTYNADGSISIDLTDGQYAFPLTACGFEDKIYGTHLAITVRNETSRFLMSLCIRASTGTASATYDMPITLDPGKTATFYVSLDFCSAFSMRKITNLVLMPSTTYTYDEYKISVIDIEVVTIK